MALEELVLGFVAGALGSFLMWLFVAPRLIVQFGGRAIERWVEKNIPEDPDAAGAAHTPLTPTIARVAKFFTWHTGRTVAGIFGDLEKRIGDELAEKGPEIASKIVGGNPADLAALAKNFGMAGKGGKSSFGGLTELFSMLSMLQQMGGALGARPNGGSGVAALPPHPFLQR